MDNSIFQSILPILLHKLINNKNYVLIKKKCIKGIHPFLF